MPRLSGLTNAIASALPCVGESSSWARSSSKKPADPDLAQYVKRKSPSEDRPGAVKVIEAAEKYRHRRVDLSRRGLKELPAKVSSLVATEELDLSKNQLPAWPAQLAGLCNLEHLNVSLNEIGDIPAAITSHTRLRSLTAHSNGICAISMAISGLRHLSKVDLSDNRLKQVPAAILGLPALKDLSLANNQIETLPAMDRMYKLKKLNLSRNPLGAIPDGPEDPEEAIRKGQLPAARLPADLEKLYLADTMLEDLPASLALPEHVGKLKKLKYLDVSSNPDMHKLPLGFGSFKTAGADTVVSLRLPDRTVELTVSHEGSGVARGLDEDGRLMGRAGRDEAARPDASATSSEGGDLDAAARRYLRRQRRPAPPVNTPLPAAGGNVPPVYANAAGMYGMAAGMAGFPPAMPAPYAPYIYPPAAPNAGVAVPQAGVGGTSGAQASTSTEVPQTQPVAAGPTGQLPGMAPPGLGPQAGAVDSQAWIMQLGVNQLVQMYQAQLQAAFGLVPQQAGQAFVPGGTAQAYASAGWQQAAPAVYQQAATTAWTAPQAAGAQLPVTTVYEGRHDADLQGRNFGIRRDQQMREVCQTIPTVLSELGVNELVVSIKSQVYSLGLSEHQTRDMISNKLVELGAGLYRQRMVDAIARREALDRADPNVDAHTRSIAYQTYLAETLGLPGPIMGLVDKLNTGQMRRDLFQGVFTDEALAREGGRVGSMVEQAEIADRLDGYKQFKDFLNKQKFWQEHTHQESLFLRNALYANLR